MKTTAATPLLLTLVLLARTAPAAGGEVDYYRVSLGGLDLEGASLPRLEPAARSWTQAQSERPYVRLDAPAEAYLLFPEGFRWDEQGRLPALELVARVPRGQEARGRLYVPSNNKKGPVKVAFRLPPASAASGSERDFHRAKETHYLDLADRNLPGTAWFRHQAGEARRAQGAHGESSAAPGGRPPRRPLGRGDELASTYDLFTGGRALSENLKLDWVLAGQSEGGDTVEVASLPGITVQEIDWKPRVQGIRPDKDRLASFIPADQHALFFPSFEAMLRVLDEADARGTPVLQLLEPRSEDSLTRERYQRQLCLPLSDVARLFGPQVVGTVAMTGSDPFLRTGSDVAILLEAKSAVLLEGYLMARQSAALQAEKGAKASTGKVAGASYHAVVSPRREVSSYFARLGDCVIVTNSLPQLQRIAEAHAGSAPALASLDEYAFFRHRYPLGARAEAAFLVIPDAAIRRWCGPRWRIADSRRTRVAAVLAELEARATDARALDTRTGGEAPLSESAELRLPWAGELRLESGVAVSSVYGTLDFLTPIAELPLERVSEAEAQAYRQFRDRYQLSWRQVFDPIALRLDVGPERLEADLTVLPLIAGTEYRQFIDLVRGGSIRPGAGDPHPGTLFRWTMALDSKSGLMREVGQFIRSAAGGVQIDPFGWLGESVTVYADADGFWEELAREPVVEKFLEKEAHRLPLAVRFDVESALGLTAFLSAVRAFVDQTAPGLTLWESLSHEGRPYVRVRSPSEGGDLGRIAVYYAASEDSILVTLNEALLKRALERQVARGRAGSPAAETSGETPPEPLGKQVLLEVDAKFLPVLQALWRRGIEETVQRRSWDNLPILNEWKRLFPTRDPAEAHQELARVKLLCPAGGRYVWNEELESMESTVCGHPCRPRSLPAALGFLADVAGGTFGLTFEDDGLRARASIRRKPAQQAGEAAGEAARQP